MQTTELDKSNAPGQSLATVLNQVQRCGAQQQVEAVGPGSIGATRAPCLVDQAAQRLKQGRQPLHFVQHDKPLLAGAQILLYVVQLVAILGRLQVQIGAIWLSNLKRQGRFAHLARSEQHHGRRAL